MDSLWKKNNESTFKYAGDSAKESVNKGLLDAKDYMKDADKGTDYTKVQDASVKRALAIDANNKELADSAVNELIGHLSAQNKEPYLAKARPLGEFVNAKDLFDYKRNNYTTTKNTTNKFDSNVQNLQRELNEKGYTDKFGNPLKEDGIMAGKTAYAYDTYIADNPQPQSQTFGNRATMPARSREYNRDKAEVAEVKAEKETENSNTFDFNTRLSYSQNYDKRVEILQKKLEELGYLDMSSGGWGYYGPKTTNAVNAYKKAKGLGNTGKDAGVVGKDTWKSLGLLYRTQKDVNAGVKIVTVGTHQYYDLTDAVVNALKKAEPEFKEHLNDSRLDKYYWFVGKVNNMGDWNIKADTTKWENALGISSESFDKKFLFFGYYITKEALGNITYGYLGRAMGLTEFELIGGSIYNDIDTHGLGYRENEKRDHVNIRRGIGLYDGKDIGAKLVK